MHAAERCVESTLANTKRHTQRLLCRFFGPGVAQCGRAIEHRVARFGIDGVGEEVAEAFELEVLAGLGGG